MATVGSIERKKGGRLEKKKPAEVASIEKDSPRDIVGSVAHGLAVLRSFDREHPQMTLSEVSERTGMTRAGARRYLLTLAHLGYVEQSGRQFRLTPKVLELGYTFFATMPLSEIAQPYLDQITAQTGETSAIAILDDHHIVHLAWARPPRQLAPTVTIGRRFNALYNSTGRVLLALMDESEVEKYLDSAKLVKQTEWSLTNKAKLKEELKLIRKQQYAIVDQESEEGLRSLAVPIFNRQGHAVAAINFITNVATVSRKQLVDDLLPVLLRAAKDISAAVVAA